jgi:phospholipid/cholesterol/gamma-HCH transport system substrate-binding protein
MEPEAKYTVVGTVVILLVALMVGAFVWLRTSGTGRDETRYKIEFARQSLDGLQIRSGVTMRGVQVGAVTDVGFSPTRAGVVDVDIRVLASTPVRESTRAVIDRNLVTGLATIRLINLNETSPLLTASRNGGVPVIGEGESQLEQVSETLQTLSNRADESLKRLNTALSDKNLAAMAATLDNLRRLSGDADHSLGQLNQTLADVGHAAQTFNAVGVDTQSTLADARTAIRQFGASTAQLSAGAAQLTANANALLQGSQVELQSTAEELRSAASSLGGAGRTLGNPRAALFGPSQGSLGPGESNK